MIRADGDGIAYDRQSLDDDYRFREPAIDRAPRRQVAWQQASNDLFGATVQLAARLCQLAEPDAILVSSAVRDRIRDGSHFVKMGPRHLRGFPQPVDVYGVEWR